VGISVPYPGVSGEAGPAGLGDLEAFRAKFYDCLSTRADALFELTDAVLCSPLPGGGSQHRPALVSPRPVPLHGADDPAGRELEKRHV
jgi:hypothetical protein